MPAIANFIRRQNKNHKISFTQKPEEESRDNEETRREGAAGPTGDDD
jgi:hypothetical protein